MATKGKAKKGNKKAQWPTLMGSMTAMDRQNQNLDFEPDRPAKKGKDKQKVVAILKEPGKPDKVTVSNQSPAELRAEQKAMKPAAGKFLRITRKMPPLR